MLNAETFLSTLISTNKSHTFFTDWLKARKNQELYKDELALLSVLNGADNPSGELRRLLRTYPRINELIPLLSAVRVKKTKDLLTVLDENSIDDTQYYFGSKGLTDEMIDASVQFADKSGLLSELTGIKNYSDYYFGVEVGLDSNARKNRSGTAMEELAETYVRDFVTSHDGRYVTQKNFATAAAEFGVEVPPNQSNKKGDFMLLIDGRPFNIETNFFDGGGSKQEIMNSYISRSEDLAKAGWGFALITDGLGWRKTKNQVEHGFKTIKYIMNLSMCSDGSLDKIL